MDTVSNDYYGFLLIVCIRYDRRQHLHQTKLHVLKRDLGLVNK